MNIEYINNYKTLAINVSYYRKLRGYTQIELAEKLDISRTHISNIEAPNQNTSISMDVFFRIAKALDVDPYKLLQDKF